MVSTEWREILSVYILSRPISWHNISLLVSAVPTARLQEKQDCPEQHAINGIFCTKKTGCEKHCSRARRSGAQSLTPCTLVCSGLVQETEEKKEKKKKAENGVQTRTIWGGLRTYLMAVESPLSDSFRECFIPIANMLQNKAREPPESRQLIIKLLTIIIQQEEGDYFIT